MSRPGSLSLQELLPYLPPSESTAGKAHSRRRTKRRDLSGRESSAIWRFAICQLLSMPEDREKVIQVCEEICRMDPCLIDAVLIAIDVTQQLAAKRQRENFEQAN